jgi:hypothetical protein
MQWDLVLVNLVHLVETEAEDQTMYLVELADLLEG